MAQGDLKTFLSLWAPVVLCAACLFLGITLAWEGEFKFSFNIGFIGISRDFTEDHVTRAAFFFLAFLSFLFPAFRDYTPFFPNDYKMIVSFNDEGIERTLKEFSSTEQADLHLISDWRLRKQNYLDQINKLIKDKSGTSFSIDRDTIGRGETTFWVHKVKRGLQTYQIDDAKGSIILENAAGGTPSIESEFTHWETDTSQIKASLIDVYFRWTMILRPQFRQYIKMGPEVQNIITLDQPVIVATKVRFFPMVKVGKSIYLTPVEGCPDSPPTEGIIQNFPIAFATYDPR